VLGDTVATKADTLLASRVIPDELARAKSPLTNRAEKILTGDAICRYASNSGPLSAKVIDHFDRIEIHDQNKAGIMKVGSARSPARDDYDRAMRPCIVGAVRIDFADVPEMLSGVGDEIVNHFFHRGKVAMQHFAPYSARKFADGFR